MTTRKSNPEPLFNRREFMRRSALGLGASLLARRTVLGEEGPAVQGQPNILLIMTDQQTATAMSCAGNPYVKTPAMDALAAAGIRFTHAYVTQPLCLPFRSSLQTARYPHEIGTLNNGLKIKGEFPLLGRLMGKAGYECAYYGKWHIGMRPKAAGYPTMSNVGHDDKKAQAARRFLLRRHDHPFFLTVSFMNPHNICQLARGEALPDGPIGEPPADLDKLPPLPSNFAIPDHEPSAIRDVQKSIPRHYPTKDWDELKWRQYLWGYYRLVEKADAEIGKVMAALKESGQEENTVVLFVSDHGEGIAMQHWNQKQVLYDQVTRVPTIVSWKGRTRPMTYDGLISPALDIPSTILDYAGISKPKSMRGLSLRPVVEGIRKTLQRDYVVAETMFAQGNNGLGLKGRMIRTKRYKYCVYDSGRNREQLFDMIADPGEVKNLAVVKEHADVLNRHRKLISDWANETRDTGFPYVETMK